MQKKDKLKSVKKYLKKILEQDKFNSEELLQIILHQAITP